MVADIKLIDDTKRLLLSRYPRFGSDIASVNIEYRNDLKYHTAATDGNNVYFDPNYLASLSVDDRIFLIAHEIMHIKFDHMLRLVDKNDSKRDLDVWNDATDAIINANLERDGFTIKKGYVNIPGSLNYSAEELYEILLKEKEQNKDNKNGQKQNSLSNEAGEDSKNKGQFMDDHSLWEEAFEKSQKQENPNQEKEIITNNFDKYNEKEEFDSNREERNAKAKQMLEKMKDEMLKQGENNNSGDFLKFNDVGESKEEIKWELLLRREIEKSETIWSQRRSIAENNYAYRLEENDLEEDSETEVMIDVSGSVDLDLVKAFLRIIKPILRHSKLKVGCFNESFWGMAEIKTTKDIDEFQIPENARGSSAWTEDWDLAVRSFSKKREINKLVFTDGLPCPGNMPKEDLKNENVIWLVYGNQNFKPCCGKVIQISENQIQKLQSSFVDSEYIGRIR